MAGSTVAEFGMKATQKDNLLTDQEIMAELKEKFGDNTDDIVAEFKKAYPDKRIALLNALDVNFRPATLAFMEKRAAETDVPGYVYNFTLEFPVEGGAFAWHCSDIPFVFHN